VGTSSLSAFDVLARLIYFDTVFFQKVNTILKGFSPTEKLEDHDALFSGKYFSLEYIEGQIEVLGQLANQGLLYFGVRKMQNQYF